MKAGIRVGAILGSKDKVVELLGFGIYEGDFDPELDTTKAVGFMAEMRKGLGLSNPRIRLDSGQVVWGCECWWGPESKIQHEIETWKASGYVIKKVDIDAIRKDLNVK